MRPTGRWTLPGLVLLVTLAMPGLIAAQGSDLQRQISESRVRLEEIRAERARLQDELEQARGGMRDASRELANIERQLSASRSVLAELDLQLEIAEHETEDNSRTMLVTRERHLEATAVLQRRLREVYKLGALHTVRVLLGADSFADLLNRYRYVQMIASYDRALVDRVGRLEIDLRSRDQELKANMVDLGRLRSTQLSELAELRSVESQRQDAINSFRGVENRTLSRLDTLGRDGQRMQGLIEDLEERRLEAERRAASAGRSSSTPSTPTTSAEVGKLDWPVSGKVIYRFGVERRPNGTTLRWNGIGISAAPGTPVQAVRAGTVVLAGPFEGYGPTVVLSHGEGLYTLYLYLEDIGVVEGRRVEMGQVVGTVGGRDTPEGPHIEFQIRNPQAQDPLPWLRPRPGGDG